MFTLWIQGKKNKKNGRLVATLKQNKGLLSLFKKYYKIHLYSEINIKNSILVQDFFVYVLQKRALCYSANHENIYIRNSGLRIFWPVIFGIQYFNENNQLFPVAISDESNFHWTYLHAIARDRVIAEHLCIWINKYMYKLNYTLLLHVRMALEFSASSVHVFVLFKIYVITQIIRI